MFKAIESTYDVWSLMEVKILGSGGSVPARGRCLPSVVIKRKSEVIMLDCGEGTQRQVVASRVGFNRDMKILLTHMHADHVLGLSGLLHSMSLLGRERKLQIFGPPRIRDFVRSMSRTTYFTPSFPVEVREVEGGVILRNSEYEISAAWASHVVPCLAYALAERPRPGKFNPRKAKALGIPEGPLWKRLQMGEKIKVHGKVVRPREILGPQRLGAKIVYAVDTRPCRAVVKLATGANLLIHDATFDSSLEEKAFRDGHSTAKQAAEVAGKAGVYRLLLTHISARYSEPDVLLTEAKKVFPRTILASDLMTINVEA